MFCASRKCIYVLYEIQIVYILDVNISTGTSKDLFFLVNNTMRMYSVHAIISCTDKNHMLLVGRSVRLIIAE
jgi:hypothetical protein